MWLQLKMCLLRSTSAKVEFRTFLATLKQITQNYRSFITDCQHGFEKGKHLENAFKKYWSFLRLSVILMFSMILGSNPFYRFKVLEKQRLIKENSQTDQVKWIYKSHAKIKHHLLRRKYYILKKVWHFRVSAIY